MPTTYPNGYRVGYPHPMPPASAAPAASPDRTRQDILDAAAQRRLRVLAYVAACLAEARPPSVREIAEHTGVSKRTAAVDLEQLEAIGWVERRPGHRGLMVTEAGLTLLAERNHAAPHLAVTR